MSESNEITTFGELVKSARISRGWKARRLASELKVDPTTVCKWERGYAKTSDLLESLSVLLAIPIEQLERAPIGAAATLTKDARRVMGVAYKIELVTKEDLERMIQMLDIIGKPISMTLFLQLLRAQGTKNEAAESLKSGPNPA